MAGVAPGAAYRVNDHALAARLSFFLWSSIPDDELLATAERGDLRAYTGDERPSVGLIDGVDVFAGAVAEFREYRCQMCKEPS